MVTLWAAIIVSTRTAARVRGLATLFRQSVAGSRVRPHRRLAVAPQFGWLSTLYLAPINRSAGVGSVASPARCASVAERRCNNEWTLVPLQGSLIL